MGNSFTTQTRVLVSNITLIAFMCLVSFQSFAEVSYATSLRGEEFEMGNLLEWSTIKEFDVENFIIQRSIDGIHFTEIGFVEAAGADVSETEYQFLDISATDKKIYYRLKEIDSNGTFNYSHVALVQKQLNNDLAILHLNTIEVEQNLSITIQSGQGAMVKVIISSLENIHLAVQNFELKAGLNEIELPMEQMAAGIYKIKIQSAHEEETLVIQKMNGEKPLTPDVATSRKIGNEE